MKHKASGSIMYLILIIITVSEVCAKNSTMQKLSIDLALQLLRLADTNMKTIDICPEPDESDINLLLFARNNSWEPIKINKTNPKQIDPAKKIILVIHGWVSNSRTYTYPQLRDAYLKRYNCNLIMVDWYKLSWQPYITSVCYLPKITRIISTFLCLVQQELNVSLGTVHLVGHSLGAQMSGFIGQDTLDMCESKIGRITGLDPAGPLYYGLPELRRLDKADAIFVDVIHTNDGVLGYLGDCGHVDFYVNCGPIQPGCPDVNIDDLLDHFLPATSCEHFRSVEYMAESVNSDGFKAKKCQQCPFLCSADLFRTTEISMGEDCSSKASGAYVLYTKSEAAFAIGSQNN